MSGHHGGSFVSALPPLLAGVAACHTLLIHNNHMSVSAMEQLAENMFAADGCTEVLAILLLTTDYYLLLTTYYLLLTTYY